ncbi:MAG: tRNA (adenosine(37)-N6)-threonylcarbamoyltransferase complex transferase subunit TsaD [Schwartzia sp.]|nr:tRNA (adenosine(37)-N6)-threonylcarbamoyltransferase complex transferase subunit TsaD [Schwartzia sp. (in: firmicutes)]
MPDSEDILTLGVESSCDETAAAVLRGGRTLLSNVISTQIPVHRKYGGVVPEIASRRHIVNVMPVIDEALQEAGVALEDIRQVAVTYGPGLVGALLVGVSAAKALAFARNIPLIGVNHLEGHIFANFLSHEELEPPFMALVVSGGHTALIRVQGYNHFTLMGQTRDDAAGEAFDKVARVMGLPYPGGPEIDKLAAQGDADAIDFPRALREKGNYEFSFSGLKSAVLNYLNEMKMKRAEIDKANVAASFQKAVIEVLVQKSLEALSEAGMKTLVLAGGVAANSALERRLREAADAHNIRFYFPSKILCTDNAAMIACRGYYQSRAGIFSDLSLNAVPGLSLKDVILEPVKIS